jgi:serine/threonine-protein kinase
MSLKVGDTIGDYEILAVLGSGGMGEVYKVRNTISNRLEAAKVLLPNLADNPELAERFVREIRVHASLEHPHIASLRTALRVENRLLMIMELVEGLTLEELLRRGKIPLADCVRYIDQALSALSYAHSRGVIHRDIKPGNMMLTPEGTIKLMDFGIAKANSERGLTRTGFAVGSLYYMSPEQIQASSEVDARSDLYALGVSLYELLTGIRPFNGDSEYSIMSAHLQTAPVPPLELDATLPSGLNDVILMAIDREPAQRFQTSQAFQNALRSVTEGLVELADSTAAATRQVSSEVRAADAGAAIPAAKPKSGHRLLYMVVGSLATVALLIVALTQLPKWRTTEASPIPVAEVSEPANTEPEKPAVESTPEISDSSETSTESEAKPDVADAAETTPRTPTTPSAQPPARGSIASSPSVSPAKPASANSSETFARPAEAAPPPAVSTTESAEVTTVAADVAAAEREKALDELQERLILMATRIGAVNSGLDVLIQEQARSGLSLRGDMTAARQRMEFRMDQAEAAIKSGDPDTAKKQLDFAQSDLEKLERFLNI